jgi:hypothetical protein
MWWLALLSACSENPGRNDEPADAAEVIWTWGEPVPPFDPFALAAPTLLTEVVQDDCNELGVEDGCPQGFACADPRVVWTWPDTVTRGRVCESEAGPYRVSVDMNPAEPPVDVSLELRVSGEPWPQGEGSPGYISLIGRTSGRRLVFVLPGTTDRLDLSLVPDTWDVTFSEDSDGSNDDWPRIPDAGVLEVRGSGTAVIDVPARLVDLTLVIDGVNHTEVPRYAQLAVTWSAGSRGLRTLWGAERPLPAKIWLYEGAWDASLILQDETDSAWPEGHVLLRGVATVGSNGGLAELRLDSQPLQGSLRINNLARSSRIGRITLRDEEGYEIGVSVSPENMFATRVLSSSYDVVLTTVWTSEDIPEGTILLAQGLTPQTGLTLNADSTRVEGEVTLHGAPLAASSRDRALHFVGENEALSKISIERDGGVFSGYVWAGPSDVVWMGDGGTSPACEMTIASDLSPGEGMQLDGRPARVDIDVRVDGAQPDNRGLVAWGLLPTEGGIGHETTPCYVQYGESGPLHMGMWLPPGTWQVFLDSVSSPDLPPGMTWLTELDTHSDVQRTVELRSHELVMALNGGRGESGGQEPFSTLPDQKRGILIFNDLYGELPDSGPAEVKGRVWSSTYKVDWLCDTEDGCAATEGAAWERRTLWSGLHLP